MRILTLPHGRPNFRLFSKRRFFWALDRHTWHRPSQRNCRPGVFFRFFPCILRSVGPTRVRAFKNPDRNSHRCAQLAATSAASCPWSSTAGCPSSADSSRSFVMEVPTPPAVSNPQARHQSLITCSSKKTRSVSGPASTRAAVDAQVEQTRFTKLLRTEDAFVHEVNTTDASCAAAPTSSCQSHRPRSPSEQTLISLGVQPFVLPFHFPMLDRL